jgi:hypothetical protein
MMKVRLRRFVTIGLMSGSLALSALVGGAAVGATNGSDRGQDQRDDIIVTANPTVAIVPEGTLTLTVVQDQVFNHDERT